MITLRQFCHPVLAAILVVTTALPLLAASPSQRTSGARGAVPPAPPVPMELDPAETGSPLNEPESEPADLDSVLKRLDQAEAEIRRLKDREPADSSAHPADVFLEEDDAGGPPAGDSSWQAPFASLERKFNELKSAGSAKKYPTVEVHGVFQVDSGWFAQDEVSRQTVGDLQDGASFRRARLSANGAVTENMNYFLQMDFGVLGRPTFTDVWWEFTKVPVLGNVRVGQWKQPFSLEVVSSFRYTTFAERSLGFLAFTPFRHIAIGFYDWREDERMTWAASVYRAGQDQYGGSITDDGGYGGVGRVTWLPWYDEENKGANYLHLGAAYNYVSPNFHLARFRTLPEYFVGEQSGALPFGTSGVAIPGPLNGVPFFVDTRIREINHYNLVGTELLWVEGPLSFQSEWMYMMATRKDGRAANFPSYYGQVGYFLTGEHRPYLKKAGAIDRVIPFRNVKFFGNDGDGGWGAWEVAARYSYIDLNSGDIDGGRLNNTTLGLNWYLNAYAKVQFNWIRAFLDNPIHGDSKTDIFGLRTQIDF